MPKLWRKWPVDLVVQRYEIDAPKDAPFSDHGIGRRASFGVEPPLTPRGALYFVEEIAREPEPKAFKRRFVGNIGLLDAPEADQNDLNAQGAKRIDADPVCADRDVGWGARVRAATDRGRVARQPQLGLDAARLWHAGQGNGPPRALAQHPTGRAARKWPRPARVKARASLPRDHRVAMTVREDPLILYCHAPEALRAVPGFDPEAFEAALRYIDDDLPHRLGGHANFVQGGSSAGSELPLQLATDRAMGMDVERRWRAFYDHRAALFEKPPL